MRVKTRSEKKRRSLSLKHKPLAELMLQKLKQSETLPILQIQSVVLETIHDFMRKEGLLQIPPVILSSITDPLGPDPEASIIKQPQVEYNGQHLVLCQSMIFHKQLALLTGAEGVYAISPNIRLEKPNRGKTGRHLFEFCQADFEITSASMDEVMGFVEQLFTRIFERVDAKCGGDLQALNQSAKSPSPPFPRFTRHEMKDKYGKNWEEKSSEDMDGFFWVTCHDREFYDKEDTERPGHFKNYDLLYPDGYGEALSGGEREYKFERIVTRLREDGLPLEHYATFLTAAKDGLLPSAGAGFGIERLMRFITGKKYIRDVTLFPRVPGEYVCF